MKAFIGLAAFLLLLATGGIVRMMIGGGAEVLDPVEPAPAPEALAPIEPAPAPDVAQAVKDNNRFALELYGELAAKDGNLFLSPYSISTALAMTYAGANGQTAEQMRDTLHYTLPDDRLHAAFATMIRDHNDAGKQRAYQLTVANALWGQAGFEFRPDFLQRVRKSYGAGFQEVDFINETESARQTINAWVEQKTQRKIVDLIPKKNILTSGTRLVLTNAIYFKAAWLDEFKAADTRKDSFWTSGGQKIETMMMHRHGDYSFVDGDTFQLIDMPYEKKELSMIAILPKQKDGLKNVEKMLTAANLEAWLESKTAYSVDVKLPKFKFTAELELKAVLSKMGMPIAFDPEADFSGITSKASLRISHVIHKAFVDVNEKSTEAAAATAVVMDKKKKEFVNVANFHADHPFVFLIRDNRTGSILFIGRVLNPN